MDNVGMHIYKTGQRVNGFITTPPYLGQQVKRYIFVPYLPLNGILVPYLCQLYLFRNALPVGF